MSLKHMPVLVFYCPHPTSPIYRIWSCTQW